LIKYEYKKFIEFIRSKIFKKIKYGKIIIVTNDVVPKQESDAVAFKEVTKHVK